MYFQQFRFESTKIRQKTSRHFCVATKKKKKRRIKKIYYGHIVFLCII